MSLAHKGLDFRRVPTPFTGVPAVEGGVSKTVPVIRDGDTVVADSFEIALYLDEAYPERPSAVRRRRRQGDGALRRALVAAHHPPLSRRGGADSTSTQGWRRPTRPISARAARSATARRWRRSRRGARPGLPPSVPSLEPLRSMLGYQPFIGGAVAALCRLHRVRGVPVGAHHVAVPGACRRTTRCRLVRALPRPHGGLGRSVAAA